MHLHLAERMNVTVKEMRKDFRLFLDIDIKKNMHIFVIIIVDKMPEERHLN